MSFKNQKYMINSSFIHCHSKSKNRNWKISSYHFTIQKYMISSRFWTPLLEFSACGDDAAPWPPLGLRAQRRDVGAAGGSKPNGKVGRMKHESKINIIIYIYILFNIKCVYIYMCVYYVYTINIYTYYYNIYICTIYIYIVKYSMYIYIKIDR